MTELKTIFWGVAIIAFGTFLATFVFTAIVALREEPLVVSPIISGTNLSYFTLIYFSGVGISGFVGSLYIAYKAKTHKVLKAFLGGVIVCLTLQMSISLILVIIPMSVYGGMVGVKKSNQASKKADGGAAA